MISTSLNYEGQRVCSYEKHDDLCKLPNKFQNNISCDVWHSTRTLCGEYYIFSTFFSFFIVFALTGLEHYFMHILLKRGSDNTAKCADHHKICHMRFI